MDMTRTTATVTISLPPAMAAELERIQKAEHRTRSELVREALRQYMRGAPARAARGRIAELPEEEPLPDEFEAIEAGRRDSRARKPAPTRHAMVRRTHRPRARRT